MPNANYIKGVRKERQLVNEARGKGYLSFRSAGSHSPIDVVIIDKEAREILLIQCKPETMSEAAKNRILQQQSDLNNTFDVRFVVR